MRELMAICNRVFHSTDSTQKLELVNWDHFRPFKFGIHSAWLAATVLPAFNDNIAREYVELKTNSTWHADIINM